MIDASLLRRLAGPLLGVLSNRRDPRDLSDTVGYTSVDAPDRRPNDRAGHSQPF